MGLTVIQPTGTIKLLANVPLDSKYQHTFSKKLFPSESNQISYFSGFAVHSYVNCTPVNINKNMIKVAINSTDIIDCNYIMFQNSNFNTKWFYAFITDVEYSSPNSCVVSYELDVMQTFLFDYNFKRSWVEREHVTDDTPGNNLTEENLEMGDFKFGSPVELLDQEEYGIVIGRVKSTNENNIMINNMYSGIKYLYYSTTADSLAFLNAMLNTLEQQGKLDEVLFMYMIPSELVGWVNTDLGPVNLYDYYVTPRLIQKNGLNNLSDIDGYQPSNKKLFAYPYNCCHVTNNCGLSTDYHFELFNSSYDIDMTCYFGVGGNPQLQLIPNNYNGLGKNYEEGLALNNFPLCAWSSDTFANWFAQNSITNAASVIGGTASLIGGIVTANPLLVGGGLAAIGSTVMATTQAAIQPDQARGSVNNGSSNLAANKFGFTACRKFLRREYAERLDHFFTMFGYKINKLKIPETVNRPYFNYVKTIDCNIQGNIPFGSIEKIKDIYDKGITLWHTSQIGNYDLNNTI